MNWVHFGQSIQTNTHSQLWQPGSLQQGSTQTLHITDVNIVEVLASLGRCKKKKKERVKRKKSQEGDRGVREYGKMKIGGKISKITFA